jgi:FMN phosphatase YigB (HAD superfamily)
MVVKTVSEKVLPAATLNGESAAQKSTTLSEAVRLRGREFSYAIFDYEGVVGPVITTMPFGSTSIRKLHEFVAKLGGVSPDEAVQLRKDLLKKYETNATQYALLREYGVSYEVYVQSVWMPEITETGKYIQPDPELQILFGKLNVESAILSNATIEYVARGLEAQGLSFRHVLGMEQLGSNTKPQPAAWTQMVEVTGFTASKTIYVDDDILNLEAPKRLGFITVLISEQPTTVSQLKIVDVRYPDVKALLRDVVR